MITDKWIRFGGWAAVAGGMCWIIKGSAILLIGKQPPLLFEIAPAFFAAAIIGLAACLDGRGRRLAQAGLAAAVIGGLSALFNSMRKFLNLITGQTIPEAELLSALAGFGWLLGLLLVGIPIWRTQALPGRWQMLPLLIAIGSFPLIIVTALAAEASPLDPDLAERMIELPLVFIALAWIGLGWVMRSISSKSSGRGEV